MCSASYRTRLLPWVRSANRGIAQSPVKRTRRQDRCVTGTARARVKGQQRLAINPRTPTNNGRHTYARTPANRVYGVDDARSRDKGKDRPEARSLTYALVAFLTVTDDTSTCDWIWPQPG